MIKTNEVGDPNSCLNRARADEPIFVLRAHDVTAPGVVRVWANDYVTEKGGMHRMSDRQLRKYKEAMDLAVDMEAWQRANFR